MIPPWVLTLIFENSINRFHLDYFRLTKFSGVIVIQSIFTNRTWIYLSHPVPLENIAIALGNSVA